MNLTLVLSIVVGLACGILVRKTSSPNEVSEESPAPTDSSQSSPKQSEPSLPELSWNLNGNLSSAQILALPTGAHRKAELSLWSLNATSEEFAAHWDQIYADGERDMTNLDHLMTLWARKDPDGALARFRGTDEEYRFWWSLGRVDPKKALSLVHRTHKKNFAKVLRGLGTIDPELALSLLEENPHLSRSDVMGGAFDGIFEDDPRRSFDMAAREDLHEWDNLQWWALREPEEALSWFVENKKLTAPQGVHVVNDLVAVLIEKNLEFATETIAGQATGKFKMQLLSSLAQNLAKSDPQKALALAKEQEGRNRIAMLNAIDSSVVDHDSSLALDLLETLAQDTPKHLTGLSFTLPIGDSTTRSGGIWTQGWVQTLLKEDPHAVMERAGNTAAESESANHGRSPLSQVFSQWTTTDPTSATTWLQNQPIGMPRDEMITSLVSVSALKAFGNQPHQNTDFGALLNLATSITQNSQRENQVGRTIHAWQK